MHIDLLLDNFRNMNHLIELDDEKKLYEGWIRFYDISNNVYLCINECSPKNTSEEDVGNIWIMSFDDPAKNMKIPDSQEDKFIKAQLIKSNMFETSVNAKKSYL